MVTSTDCNTRVFFGMLPFVLALGTWWLGYLGRLGWLLTVALIALQVVGIHQRWWDGTRYASIASNAVAGELGEESFRSSPQDLDRCQLDREVDRFVGELKAMGDKARDLSCLFRDEKQLGESTVMRLFPGVNCSVLAIKMGRSFEQVPSVTLHASHEDWTPPPPPPMEERDGMLLLHIGARDAPVAKLQARYTELTQVKLQYLRFRHIKGGMGFHLIRPAEAPKP